MRATVFYLKQTLLLGTVGYLLFVLAVWSWAGPFLVAGGWLVEWLLALALVAAFVLFLVTPLQLLFRRLGFGRLSPTAGILAGPVAVVLVLLVLGTPTTFHFFVADALFLHVLLAALGGVFAFNFQRWLAHPLGR